MNELKKIRESLNITQVEAAELLNVSRRTYQKYESITESDNNTVQYFIYKLQDMLRVDEEHGILTLDNIKEIVNQVFSKYNINFCYLFGSYAKNKAKPSSDVDLLIDSEITGLDFFGLVEDLRQSLHKEIDLLKLNQLENNQILMREIMKDGIKIYG